MSEIFEQGPRRRSQPDIEGGLGQCAVGGDYRDTTDGLWHCAGAGLDGKPLLVPVVNTEMDTQVSELPATLSDAQE